MLIIINFVFPISTFMVIYSRWGSYSASGDIGCLEKVIDLLMKMSNPSPWQWSLGGVIPDGVIPDGVIPDAGDLGF